MEKCPVPPAFNHGHAPKLDPVVSSRKKDGVQYQAGETQAVGNQPSKVAWLNQVEGDWNRMLYKTALDWSQKEVPADVAELLVDVSAQAFADKGKWISFLEFGDEWMM